MLSVMPLSGSVRVQGSLLPGQLTYGDVEFVLRSRWPMIWRVGENVQPVGGDEPDCRPAAASPSENCWKIGMMRVRAHGQDADAAGLMRAAERAFASDGLPGAKLAPGAKHAPRLGGPGTKGDVQTEPPYA